MIMKYIGRRISDEFLKQFIIDDKEPSNSGKFSVITSLVRQDPYLDFEMRGDCVIIYYRGGKLLTIKDDGVFETLADKYYIDDTAERLTFDINNAFDYISKAKFVIDKHEMTFSKLGEKEIQQRVVYENNLSVNSAKTEYFIADVEWAENSVLGGRADIIAFKWNRMEHSKRILQLVLIEVKQGDGAISGKNGLKKHYDDFVKFKSNSEYVGLVAQDMLIVLKQKYELGLVKGLDILFMRGDKPVVPKIEKVPDFLFLLGNYHHFSTKLKAESDSLPNESRFILSSFMGYGLYEKFIKTKAQMQDMFPFVFK